MYGAAKYGQMTMPLPFTGPPLAVDNGAVTNHHRPKFLDPESPELWLVGIGALTLGLIAISTSVKVGPIHLSGSI